MAERNPKNQKTDSGKDSLTPLMQQYHEIKSQYPGMLLFFRLGDFYEMFGDDAKKASSVLEVVLTQRQGIPMCGVPYHSVNSYLRKLVKSGEKIAICEQLEEPGQAKGIVKRGVVRVITPGTILEENLLSSKENNYIVSVLVSQGSEKIGISYADISTGEFQTTETDKKNLKYELMKLSPQEIIFPESVKNNGIYKAILNGTDCAASFIEDWRFDYGEAQNRIKQIFKLQSLKPFNLENKTLSVGSIGGLLAYLEKTQVNQFPQFQNIRYYSLDNCLLIDETAVKNLELIEGINTRTKENSLLEIIDFTLSPMGGRLLRNYILRPLIDVNEILYRQSRVSFFIDEGITRRKVRDLLKKISDIERIVSRCATFSAYPRELISLKNSLEIIPSLKQTIFSNKDLVSLPESLSSICGKLKIPEPIFELINKSIVEEPPVLIKEGGVIKEGYNSELDELQKISKNGKSFISQMESSEREKTKIGNLKIGYTSVFGYFIEVSKSNLSLVPQHYIRKQTLTNGERYITPELKTLEEKILSAEEKILKLESKLFREVMEQISSFSKELFTLAQSLAEVDVYSSLAEAAVTYNYTKPKIDDSFEMSIKDGRHPVVERKIKSGTFVSNDTYLNADTDQIILLTGPNMSGKSTYLRQTALIVILAQIGSFVPASDARIGIVDRIFTRIGSGDNLAKGESTFMVEMHETAHILNQYSARSLIILDEIGRGTSTYDGISIAWATVEYLLSRRNKESKGPKVLFATHYFELTELERKMKGVKNYNVSVKEYQNDVIFLHKIEPGAADKSYGIHVAQLAGIPKGVIKKANDILFELENKEIEETVDSDKKQLDFFVPQAGRHEIEYSQTNGNSLKDSASSSSKIMVELDKIDTNSLTPLEALAIIDKWKKEYNK